MARVGIVRREGATNAQSGAHAGLSGGIELRWYVRDEEHVTRFLAERCRNLTITSRFAFRPRRRIEVTGQERREITCRGVREKIALRLDAAGGKDRDRLARAVPPLERRAYIGIDCAFAPEPARALSVFTDPALQTLQARRFAIAIHQPIDIGFGIPGRKIRRRRQFRGVLGA